MRKNVYLFVILLFLSFLTVETKAAPVKLTVQEHGYRGDNVLVETSFRMEVGQKVEAGNLVFKVGKKSDFPLEYCKSKTGFKAKSRNTEIVSVKSGVLTAKKAGQTTVVVTKNGQKFKFHIKVTEQKYTITSKYKYINRYLETLSKKYPDEASVKGRGTTFIKSMSKLTRAINSLHRYICECEDTLEMEYWQGSNAAPNLTLAGILTEDTGYLICLENPREYFRLAKMAQEYIQKQAKQAKDLKIKSVVKVTTDKRWNNHKVTVKLKKAMDWRQALCTYADYNPYDVIGSLPTNQSWKTDLKAYYEGKLYKITNGGKESEIGVNVFVTGKTGSDLLEVDIYSLKKPGDYKVYFNVDGAEDPKKYSVTFTIE